MNIAKEDKFCGIATKELFHKVSNNFVREYNGIHYFKPTQDGQMDYMVYIALLSKINAYEEVEISLNRLVESIGYKPKTGKGKINEKVRESLKRLEYDYKLIVPAPTSTDKYLMLEVRVLETEERFFKLNLNNIRKILNSSFKLRSDDFTNKYTDKAKALYVYSYLLSMFGVHETTTIGTTFNGCYPNMDKICAECNVTKEYLLKLLAYFEFDGLIFTANIGTVEGVIHKSNNYYTDSLSGLSGAYTYATAYLDKKQIKYKSNYMQCKELLLEIDGLFNEAYTKLNDKEVIRFKEQCKSVAENIIYKASEIFNDVSIDGYRHFIINREYLTMKLYKQNQHILTDLLYLASIYHYNVLLLTHFKNKLKALIYLYEVR